MNLTIKQIADICGVSRGSVDRALNNRPGINSETRQKILQVARELDYKPDFLAQSLVKGKTMTIGAVVFDINNRVFPQLIHAVESRAREKGYFLYLTLTNKDPDVEIDCINHLVSRRVDGIILLTVNKGPKFIQLLQKQNVPIVTFANYISKQFPYIWINDRQAIKDAVKLLISKGYEEIFYVSPPLALKGMTNLYALDQRYRGFLDVTANTSLRTTVISHKNFMADLYDMVRASSRRKAILCTSDLYAINILIHFKEKGLRIPEDVGLMGFDNIDILRATAPRLATVSYSTDDLGKTIMDTMTARIDGLQTPSRYLLRHEIIPGSSL